MPLLELLHVLVGRDCNAAQLDKHDKVQGAEKVDMGANFQLKKKDWHYFIS